MKQKVEFETEKQFQEDLANDLKMLGWQKVVLEYNIPKTQYFIDILACGGSLKKPLIVECKKTRPDSLASAIAQVLKYRGVLANPNQYDWVLSWPGTGPSNKDKLRMASHGVSWLDPSECKHHANHPEEATEAYLKDLEEEIDTHLRAARELQKIYDDTARKLEAHKAVMRTMKEQIHINGRIAKECMDYTNYIFKLSNGAAKAISESNKS